MTNKLKLKPGQTLVVLNAPAGALTPLYPLPDSAQLLTELTTTPDMLLLFATNSIELRQHLPAVLPHITAENSFWVAYPKKSSKIQSDLTRDEGWAVLDEAKLRGAAQIAYDDQWAVLRFQPLAHATRSDVLTAQYVGKEVLRPIYEKLVTAGQACGADVELQIRNSYVALARGKQFATLQPSTKTRFDVAFKLKNHPFTGRLQPVKNVGSGAMTHQLSLTQLEEVDEEVLTWLRLAYEEVGA